MLASFALLLIGRVGWIAGERASGGADVRTRSGCWGRYALISTLNSLYFF